MPFDQEFYVASPRNEPAMPIGHQRLLVLAEFLETKVPREKFNMAWWSAKPRLTDCGSVGCACGWATTIPEFAALGLQLAPTQMLPRTRAFPNEATIIYQKSRGFKAAAKFFGITEASATGLFDHTRYLHRHHLDPNFIAARIRAFVAEQSIAARTAELTRLG